MWATLYYSLPVKYCLLAEFSGKKKRIDPVFLAILPSSLIVGQFSFVVNEQLIPAEISALALLIISPDKSVI